VCYRDPAQPHIPPESRDDPWYYQIPCDFGIIYPHGADTLALEIDYHNPTANRVLKIPGTRLSQDGDFEKTILFSLSLFDQVAEIVKPKRRRVLTPEQRAALAEAGSATRFQKDRGSDRPNGPETDPGDEGGGGPAPGQMSPDLPA
jgi:hypothetical protein